MRILVVDESNGIADLLADALAQIDDAVPIVTASSLDSAELLLEQGNRYDVALVAVSGSGRDAVTIPARLKSICPRLVTVVITIDDSSSTALELVRSGIQDCIPRYELTPRRLLRTIELARERDRREQQLKRIACTDALTGSLNRRGLMIAAQDLYRTASRLNEFAALLTIDLDLFKRINDQYGHPFGDLVLRTSCRRIAHCVRRHDAVGRAGGDEFWVLLNGVARTADVRVVAEKIIRHIEAPILIDGDGLHVSASIGIALAPCHGPTVDAWVMRSDQALYEAKKHGKNRWCIYSPERNPAADHAMPKLAG